MAVHSRNIESMCIMYMMYVYIRRVYTHTGIRGVGVTRVSVCLCVRVGTHTTMGIDQSPPPPHTINLELIHLFVNLQQSAARFAPFSSNLVKAAASPLFYDSFRNRNLSILPRFSFFSTSPHLAPLLSTLRRFFLFFFFFHLDATNYSKRKHRALCKNVPGRRLLPEESVSTQDLSGRESESTSLTQGLNTHLESRQSHESSSIKDQEEWDPTPLGLPEQVEKVRAIFRDVCSRLVRGNDHVDPRRRNRSLFFPRFSLSFSLSLCLPLIKLKKFSSQSRFAMIISSLSFSLSLSRPVATGESDSLATSKVVSGAPLTFGSSSI